MAVQLWTILSELDAVTPVTAVHATGGVFPSPLWRRVLADVLDRPITVTDGAEGSARGAAALGLISIGRAAALREAVALLRPDHTDEAGPTQYGATIPDPVGVDRYRELRENIPRLLATYNEVAALFTAAGRGTA